MAFKFEWWWRLAWTLATFYSNFIHRNRSIARSLRRNGKLLFSTRLFVQRPTYCFAGLFSSVGEEARSGFRMFVIKARLPCSTSAEHEIAAGYTPIAFAKDSMLVTTRDIVVFGICGPIAKRLRLPTSMKLLTAAFRARCIKSVQTV